jgi:hypothetical protein
MIHRSVPDTNPEQEWERLFDELCAVFLCKRASCCVACAARGSPTDSLFRSCAAWMYRGRHICSRVGAVYGVFALHASQPRRQRQYPVRVSPCKTSPFLPLLLSFSSYAVCQWRLRRRLG